ncbi:hypothetical protein D3C85_15270 [compost metagenome]
MSHTRRAFLKFLGAGALAVVAAPAIGASLVPSIPIPPPDNQLDTLKEIAEALENDQSMVNFEHSMADNNPHRVNKTQVGLFDVSQIKMFV